MRGFIVYGLLVLALLTAAKGVGAAPVFQGLGDLAGGGFSSRALGVSADGAVVVGSSDSGSGLQPFFWDSVHGMRSLRDVLNLDFGLDLSGWLLDNVAGLSADGTTIVGTGINSFGNLEAWIVRLDSTAPIPEPGTWPLLGTGLVGLPGSRWWRLQQAI